MRCWWVEHMESGLRQTDRYRAPLVGVLPRSPAALLSLVLCFMCARAGTTRNACILIWKIVWASYFGRDTPGWCGCVVLLEKCELAWPMARRLRFSTCNSIQRPKSHHHLRTSSPSHPPSLTPPTERSHVRPTTPTSAGSNRPGLCPGREGHPCLEHDARPSRHEACQRPCECLIER